MVTLSTTKNDLVVKTAAIRKIAKRKFPTNAAPGHPRLPRDCLESSEGASARPEMPFWGKEMSHRATFLANDGVFDHKRAGAGQNRRHLQKQLPVSRGGSFSGDETELNVMKTPVPEASEAGTR